MAQNLVINILAKDKTKQAFGVLKTRLGVLKKSIFSVQSALVGLGAGLVARNLINTGKDIENLRVRLKFLLKDTNEGAKAFDNMSKFASKVPFSLEEISLELRLNKYKDHLVLVLVRQIYLEKKV